MMPSKAMALGIFGLILAAAAGFAVLGFWGARAPVAAAQTPAPCSSCDARHQAMVRANRLIQKANP